VRQALEVADIFRRHGPAWRATHAGHVSLAQLKAMSAIEACRTAALGGAPSTCWTEVAVGRDQDGVLVVTPQR